MCITVTDMSCYADSCDSLNFKCSLIFSFRLQNRGRWSCCQSSFRRRGSGFCRTHWMSRWYLIIDSALRTGCQGDILILILPYTLDVKVISYYWFCPTHWMSRSYLNIDSTLHTGCQGHILLLILPYALDVRSYLIIDSALHTGCQGHVLILILPYTLDVKVISCYWFCPTHWMSRSYLIIDSALHTGCQGHILLLILPYTLDVKVIS